MEMSNALFNQTDPLMPSKALVLAHLDPHSVYHCPLDSYPLYSQIWRRIHLEHSCLCRTFMDAYNHFTNNVLMHVIIDIHTPQDFEQTVCNFARTDSRKSDVPS